MSTPSLTSDNGSGGESPRGLSALLASSLPGAGAARSGSAAPGAAHIVPATHSTMLSSRRWPADEARPPSVLGTPTKRDDSGVRPDAGERSEMVGLDLSGARIRTLTPNICRFTFLTELRLANNFLARLPAGIGQLRALAFLDLSSNHLAALPAEIGWLTSLKELLLFNNILQDLPSEMGFLYQLENLGIDGNPVNDSLTQLAHTQGPLAIIPFLRDHMICTRGGAVPC